jgi:hypothetical protein
MRMLKFLSALTAATLFVVVPDVLGDGPVLCSNVTAVIGYGGVNCYPTNVVSRSVVFTLTYAYSQPYSTSPVQYTPGPTINASGSGVCLAVTNTLGPTGVYTVSLNGSGNNYSTYQQKWIGQVENWGYVLALPAVISVTTLTPSNFQATGCCQ